MMDHFVELLLRAAESFLTTLASKLAERLAAAKKPKTRKTSSPRCRKQKTSYIESSPILEHLGNEHPTPII